VGIVPARVITPQAPSIRSDSVIVARVLSAPELTNYNLYEVVTDITLDVPGGAFAGVASANVNADRWRAISTEDRAALLWGGSHMTASSTWNFYMEDAEAIQRSRDLGIKIHEADEELNAAVKEFSRLDLQSLADRYKSELNVTRAPEIATEFPAILERWYGLVADIESKEQLQALYWDEVISKVDPATYAQ
jgi:hypothetical protein